MRSKANIAWAIFHGFALLIFILSSAALILLIITDHPKPPFRSHLVVPRVLLAWLILMAGLTILAMRRRLEKPSTYCDISI